jgi:DNA repair exonuclease SbcCD ATPase subunit
MSASDFSLSPVSFPPESAQRDSLQVLPFLTRLVYRWCIRLINRMLERFPTLQHGITRLEAAETTIRRLRQERDEALKFLRERNHELAHYDTAVRNLLSAIHEVTHEIADLQQVIRTYGEKVAEHLCQREHDILQLQYHLQEAVKDMKEVQADLDNIETLLCSHLHRLARQIETSELTLSDLIVAAHEVQSDLNALEEQFHKHFHQLGQRVHVSDLALLGILEAAKKTTEELDLLEQQVEHQHKTFLHAYSEATAENERLSQEINTLVAEFAQTNEMTANYIRSLEEELAMLRSRTP